MNLKLSQHLYLGIIIYSKKNNTQIYVYFKFPNNQNLLKKYF